MSKGVNVVSVRLGTSPSDVDAIRAISVQLALQRVNEFAGSLPQEFTDLFTGPVLTAGVESLQGAARGGHTGHIGGAGRRRDAVCCACRRNVNKRGVRGRTATAEDWRRWWVCRFEDSVLKYESIRRLHTVRRAFTRRKHQITSRDIRANLECPRRNPLARAQARFANDRIARC